jgi:hypothetical protein
MDTGGRACFGAKRKEGGVVSHPSNAGMTIRQKWNAMYEGNIPITLGVNHAGSNL